MFAKIVNETTKEVSVGVGSNVEAFKKRGMSEMDVEQAYDGRWYVAGYAPEKSIELIAEEKRVERNKLLIESDKFMIKDFPLSTEEKKLAKEYRTYLRDIPQKADFPNVKILSFEEWKAEITAELGQEAAE